MQITRLTPILIVDRIAPCLAFWTTRLGFTLQTEVPGDDGPAFVILQHGDIEVMYQTRASVIADLPSAADDLQGHSTALFLTVDDFDAVERALAGVPVIKGRHRTFYGSTEMYVREPGGHTVGFAQMDG